MSPTPASELYHELIMDHNRRPRHRGALARPTHRADGVNPLCGDRVRVELVVESERIAEAAFDGAGCAISTASASLMADAVTGRTVEDARALSEAFRAAMTDPEPPAGGPALGKLEALAGVRAFPARVKCATLPWHALRAALDGGAATVTTETKGSP